MELLVREYKTKPYNQYYQKILFDIDNIIFSEFVFENKECLIEMDSGDKIKLAELLLSDENIPDSTLRDILNRIIEERR